MNVLILTDHSAHNSTNSFYGIANALVRNPEVRSVYIVSRGLETNAAYFEGDFEAPPVGFHMTEPVAFESFTSALIHVEELKLPVVDILLLRLPRPVKRKLLLNLKAEFSETLIVNDPFGIIETGNKAFLATLDRFVPPCRVCHGLDQINAFASQFPIVLKPLEGYGGDGLMRIDGDRAWLGLEEVARADFERIYSRGPVPYLAMKFLNNTDQGDKRITIASGKILVVSVRYPAPGSWLCNVSQGGYAEYVEPDDRDREIAAYISPILDKHGIFVAGVDTLVGDGGLRFISEINTLSVGGIVPAEKATGQPLTRYFAEQLVDYYKRKKTPRDQTSR